MLASCISQQRQFAVCGNVCYPRLRTDVLKSNFLIIEKYIFASDFETKTTGKHEEEKMSLETAINILKYFSSTCVCMFTL